MDGAKPRTISELAELLGVSAMTIHRAIAGKPDISPGTRERILAEIERLGWRPNIAARSLRKGKTFTLGILVSNVAASFLPEILQGVNREAEASGCHTFVSVHENDPARASQHLRTLHSKGVDGIIYYPTDTGAEAELLTQIHEAIPVVTIMRPVAGFPGRAILVDDRRGGRLAAEHLLLHGHTRIGFVGYRDSPFSEWRRAGCAEALEERGLELPAEWSITDLLPGEERAVCAVMQMLARQPRPTALFCASDRLAARAMQAAAALRLSVPADLSVIGFNGDAWGALLAPPLTTVAQPRTEIGELAARLVLGLEPATEQTLVVRPRLVKRGSTTTAESVQRSSPDGHRAALLLPER